MSKGRFFSRIIPIAVAAGLGLYSCTSGLEGDDRLSLMLAANSVSSAELSGTEATMSEGGKFSLTVTSTAFGSIRPEDPALLRVGNGDTGLSLLQAGQKIELFALENKYLGPATTRIFVESPVGAARAYTIRLNDDENLYTTLTVGSPRFLPRPTLALDHGNSKMLILNENFGTHERPRLQRCNLDATNCAITDISAGVPAKDMKLLFDEINRKVLVVGTTADGKPGLYRCDADGSNCTHRSIDAGQSAGSGSTPSAVVDTINSRLLVVTRNDANGGRPGLFRCELDGTSCQYHDISVGQGANSGMEPVIAVNRHSGRLMAVTRNEANGGRLALFRCRLDGTNCVYRDISAGQGENSGIAPNLILDHSNSRMLVTAQNRDLEWNISLYRCGFAGGNCTHRRLESGLPSRTYYEAALALDIARQHLYVLATAVTQEPRLYRCEIDGSNCRGTDIGHGQNGRHGSMLIDPLYSRLVIMANNKGFPGVWRVAMDYEVY